MLVLRNTSDTSLEGQLKQYLDRRTLPLWRVIAFALACLIGAASVVNVEAQDPDQVTLALEQADIADFIRWASQQTGKNIILHPSVKGKVTVLAGDALTPEEAYGVFISTLQVHGYAVVQSDNALKVVPAPEATSQYAPLTNEDSVGLFDDVVVRVVRVHHLPTDQVTQLIQPLLTTSALLQTSPGSNLIIVGDRRGNIERALALIEEMDRADISEVRSLPVKFAAAEAIIQQIMQLLPDLFVAGSSTHISLIQDARTNTLLASGPPAILDEIQNLVKQLDQPMITDSLTQVVHMEYLDAIELVAPLLSVAESLKKLQNENESATGDVSINVSESNNALIITAPENIFTALNNVIHQLDVRRTQVLIEAIIVEVSAEKFMDLGINWRTNVPEGDGIFAGGNFSQNTPTPNPPSLGTGLTLGFFNSGELRVFIRAIAGDSDTNFLSTPTLVTLDNHEAEILVGENIPLITGSSTGSASSTENPFQTIERHDIGVSLKVVPRVNTDNSMTLTVSQTVESISPSSALASDIVTSKRQITTTVLIEDDEVLVLGGLIRDDLSQKVSKVPLLGDLPVLGHLFRSTSDVANKRNLMVFLHPRILHRKEDNVEVTTKYTRGMNAARQDFLKTTNSFVFPKTLPNVTDPLPLELPDDGEVGSTP